MRRIGASYRRGGWPTRKERKRLEGARIPVSPFFLFEAFRLLLEGILDGKRYL